MTNLNYIYTLLYALIIFLDLFFNLYLQPLKKMGFLFQGLKPFVMPN